MKNKNKLLGLINSNEIEILKLMNWALDMIGLGAYKNKYKDVKFLGENFIFSKISKHPVCAIGGVKKDLSKKNLM